MKKYLLLFIFPLLLFIPKDTYAETSITYVPSAVAYFDFCGNSGNCGRANAYAQTDSLPIYPLNFYNVNYYSFNHDALEFSFYSPTNFNSLQAYNFKVAFNYAVDGMQKLYHTEYLNGGLYPNENIEIVQSKEISITTSNDISDNRIVIEGTMILKEPINVSTFMVGLSAETNGVSGSLAACSSESGSMLPVCSNNIVSQLSLLSIEVTPIVDSDDLLLNDLVNNTKVTNEKLDEMIDEIGEVKDAITSEEGPNLDALEDSAGWLPPGPVDSILNLPLSLFQNLSSALSNTCQPVQATLPFINTSITLPCISSLYEQIGIQSFLNWVGVVVGCIILYNYFIALYKWVDDTLTFRENTMPDWGGV